MQIKHQTIELQEDRSDFTAAILTSVVVLGVLLFAAIVAFP